MRLQTGYSTIIPDSKDGSVGICRPDGRFIGQAFRPPLHCGKFLPTIEAVRDTDGDDIEPDGVFAVNDPYQSEANLVSGLLVIRHVFSDGELIASCTNRVHKPDVGRLVPGTSLPDA